MTPSASAPASTVVAPSPSIELVDVSRRFGDVAVVRKCSFVRSEPGCVGITGSNGSGKTTLLRMCAQLCAPDSGSIAICGIRVEEGDAAVVRALVGYAPHEVLAYPASSVRANLRQSLRLTGMSRRAAGDGAERAMLTWGLLGLAELAVGRLSRGQAQRYALARADLLAPPVLLLDEPTVGLDDAARSDLDAAIDRWKRDRIVLIASHEADWLRGHADQVVAMAPLQARTAVIA